MTSFDEGAEDLDSKIHKAEIDPIYQAAFDDGYRWGEAEALKNLMQRSHTTACSKGWWDKDRGFPEQIALMHSELSEALEEYRKGEPLDFIFTSDGKPEGIAVELADTLIRIFDTCERYDIPLTEALELKMKYNTTRPVRHGGKIA